MEQSVLSSGQLNSSSSKMKYSFPRSGRFDNKRYISGSPDKFYDLPEIKTKRTTTFGYGCKVDLSKQNFKTPGPEYKLHSSFDLKDKEGITMGFGREKVKANDMFQENFKKPSPLEYNPQVPKKSLSYSLSSRNPDLTDKWIKSIPGPGNYSNELKGSLSKYESAPSTRFGKLQRLSQAELKNPKTPGPGQYPNLTEVSKKFKQRKGNQFPKSTRPSMANSNKVPGPGEYKRASDFD